MKCKRILCLLLATVLMLSVFTGCENEKTPPQTTGKQEEAEKPINFSDKDSVKILMIGQSHAQDSVWLLGQVLEAELPDKEILVVDVYQPLNIDQHIENIKNNAAVYDYSVCKGGLVETTPETTITDALRREQWDLIAFNEATFPQCVETSYTDGDMQWYIDYFRETALSDFVLAYNATWAQPIAAELYGADRRQPPENFRDNFTNSHNADRLLHFDKICSFMETYIETHKDIDLVFPSGTAIQYASETFGVPEADPMRTYDLYRDYTHLSDFGRLIVAYVWYAKLFGIEELTEVKVDVIKKNMRATTREMAFGDLVLTEEHKQAIIESVNYALKNPHKAPEQKVRQTAVLESLTGQ